MEPSPKRKPFDEQFDRVIQLAPDRADAFILNELVSHSHDLVKHAAESLGLSRQAIQQRLRRLIANGQVVAVGTTRNRRYTLGLAGTHALTVTVASLEEDEVWRKFSSDDSRAVQCLQPSGNSRHHDLRFVLSQWSLLQPAGQRHAFFPTVENPPQSTSPGGREILRDVWMRTNSFTHFDVAAEMVLQSVSVR